MSDLPQIPRRSVMPSASTAPIGAKLVFPYSAVRVDTDFHCWVDPSAKPGIATKQSDGTLLYDGASLSLERVEGGFRLDLTAEIPSRNSRQPRPFEAVAKPEPTNGVEWIPVVEIVVPHDAAP